MRKDVSECLVVDIAVCSDVREEEEEEEKNLELQRSLQRAR